MLDVVLDQPGSVSLQEVVDCIDYGPHELSPRMRKQVGLLSKAFSKAVNDQLKKCANGEHMMRGGRCWMCQEAKLKIVKDG